MFGPGLAQKLRPYAAALLWVAGSTVVAFAAEPYAFIEDQAMIYLFGVVLVSLRYDTRVSIFATVASVVAYDFFFIPPRMAFAATDAKNTLTFLAMLVVAVVISGLSQRLRKTAWATDALYQLNVELATAGSARQLTSVAARHLERLFGGHALILLRTQQGTLERPADLSTEEMALAERAWNRGDCTAGWRTGGYATWIALKGIHEPLGVIGLTLPRTFPKESAEWRLFSECARELATALERLQLADTVRRTQLAAEAEHMRSSLLSAVSHDLKTPLATIVAAGTTLLSHRSRLDTEASQQLLSTVVREGERLGRLVQNLLSISRLESPTIELRKTPEAIEEIVATSVDRMSASLGARPLTVNVSPDLPFVMAEPALVDQVLTNLLENVVRYTAATSAVEIAARADDDFVTVQVADDGPGVPEPERDKVFEKFYRGSRATKNDGGVGLGLTICRAIVRAHGGRIAVRERPGGGTLVEFTLPVAPSAELPEHDQKELSE
jgi:two-component system sensor histidine kinase KdpD